MMLFLEKPIHPDFLPLVEHSIVGLPYPLGKLLQGGFGWLQATREFTLCTAQVQLIVNLITCIILVLGNQR
jgi:hypothetical protein